MRLTKKKAVEITKELWGWCAKTGEQKAHWPGWKHYKYGSHAADCPLCEYVTYKGCSCCPLYGMWDEPERSNCGSSNSPYRLWDNTFEGYMCGDVDAAKKYAQQIVDLCDRWLKEHTKGGVLS